MLNILEKVFKRKGGDLNKSGTTMDKNMIFTHNCAARIQIVAGRLEQTASMMSLGSTLGTTVDGTHKGAGITKMQGQISRVQYYFEEQKWIDETYFSQRGLDSLGYLDGVSEQAADEIELEGDIDLDNTNSTVKIEFAGEQAEIDMRKDQKFEEVQLFKYLLLKN